MRDPHATSTINLDLLYVVNKLVIAYANEIFVYIYSHLYTMWQTIGVVLFDF